jgi:hypothetical protein
MRAARIDDLSHSRTAHQPAPQQSPPAQDLPVRPAMDGDAGAASPVHGMHDRLFREFDVGCNVPMGRRKIDPVNIAVVLAAVLYTVAFWSGLIAVGTNWMHQLAGR